MGEGCDLTPLGGQLGKPEAPVEERHTGSLLLLLRFLRSCGAPGSQTPVGAYRIPGTQVSLPIVGFVEDPVYVRSCGAGEGSLLLLLLRAGVSLA